MDEQNKFNAEVIGVYPNKIKIAVNDLKEFSVAGSALSLGSYLRISDNKDCAIIAMVENYCIEKKQDDSERQYIIEAVPIGFLDNKGKFQRGGNQIAIPPTGVEAATKDEIQKIYYQIPKKKRFTFAKLSKDDEIVLPVDGDRFFNKHIAIVGSTGSGKSHTLAKIIQEAVKVKNGEYDGLNNSHIIVFDIHSEYKAAFPESNHLLVDHLALPYWLMKSEELEDLFIDTEAQDHNQRNIFKEAVVKYKKEAFLGPEESKHQIHYDSPTFFDIDKVLEHAQNKNTEMVPGSGNKEKQGPLFGKLSNFTSRLENKLNDKRLQFLLGEAAKNISFEETLMQFIGYRDKGKANCNANL